MFLIHQVLREHWFPSLFTSSFWGEGSVIAERKRTWLFYSIARADSTIETPREPRHFQIDHAYLCRPHPPPRFPNSVCSALFLGYSGSPGACLSYESLSLEYVQYSPQTNLQRPCEFQHVHGNNVIIQNNVHLLWTVRHKEINIYLSSYISYLFKKHVQTSVLSAGW